MTKKEEEYNIDDLKVNRYLKASFKASEYYNKTKKIEKDYEDFIKSTNETKIKVENK